MLSRASICNCFITALVLALIFPLHASGQGTGGTIVGAVVDAQSGVMPGVTLTLRNTESGTTQTAISEADGKYHFPSVQPGVYDLKAELEGFATIDFTGLTVTIGLEVRRDVTMKVRALEESVTVVAEAPIIETTKSDVSGVVTQQQIASLPVNSRQAVTLALLLPGTSQDAERPRKVNVTVGAGGTFFSSAFLVDGVTNQEAKAGEPRQDFPQGAIREFKVNLTQAPAAFGGGTGGYVTIVSKSGTNSFSGEAFEFFRDKSLNTLNKFEQQQHDQLGTPKPDFRRDQYGTSVGGPIIKNRLHIFGSLDWTKVDQVITVDTNKPQFYSSLEGSFPNPSWRHIAFVRGDGQINGSQNAFVRWGWEHDHIGCETCGGINSAFTGSGVEQNRYSVVAGHTWVITSRLLNEARAQYAPFNFLTEPPGAPTPFFSEVGVLSPERAALRTQVYSFPSLTWGTSSSGVQKESWTELRDDVTYTIGKHSFKVGGAFLNVPTPEDALGNLGTWSFDTDQPFNPNDPASVAALQHPIRFTASFPSITRRLDQWQAQGYVQDDWKPISNLTLNLGVRYDLQVGAFNENLDLSIFPRPLPFVDPSVRGDHNNFGPRLGFAWDVKGNGSSVVRGGYGVYYQPIWTTVGAGERSNLLQSSISITNPSYPDPYQGRDPLSFASTAPPNITILSNDLVNPKAHAYNVGISQAVASTMAIHVDGIYTHTVDYSVAANINTPDPVTKVRPIAGWGNISQFQSIGVADYKALLVRFDKRFEHNYQYLVSYTLASSEDNFPFSGVSTTTSLSDVFNPGLDVGPANNDRLQTLVISGATRVPGGITVGAVWSLRSTMPFNALAGADLNGDGALTDYVPGTSRNQGNRDSNFLQVVNDYRATKNLAAIPESQIDSNRYNSLDVRVSKAFSLGGKRSVEFIGQVFNLFGVDNLLPAGTGGGWVTNALSDSFGRILTANNRQQGEIAARVSW